MYGRNLYLPLLQLCLIWYRVSPGFDIRLFVVDSKSYTFYFTWKLFNIFTKTN
jgi:hypothetical protein